MHHTDRSAAEKFQRKISVADAVHGVLADIRKPQTLRHKTAVGVVSRARQSSGTQRADIHSVKTVLKTAVISFKHLKIRHEMIRRRHRLRSLKMRIPRHEIILMFFRDLISGMQQPFQIV